MTRRYGTVVAERDFRRTFVVVQSATHRRIVLATVSVCVLPGIVPGVFPAMPGGQAPERTPRPRRETWAGARTAEADRALSRAVALATEWAQKLARGPQFAHRMTKRMLEQEHGMSLRDAMEAEAQAQAICMQHPDFRTAHDAFKRKERPVFEGAEICDD